MDLDLTVPRPPGRGQEAAVRLLLAGAAVRHRRRREARRRRGLLVSEHRFKKEKHRDVKEKEANPPMPLTRAEKEQGRRASAADEALLGEI